MYHSITFARTYNTWDDWHLIPTVLPVVAPPAERTIQVTVPGKNGKTDLSPAMTGEPIYENREGSWSFYVDWDGWRTDVNLPDGPRALEQIGYLLASEGVFVSVELEDEPGFVYNGRVWMDTNYDSKQNHGVVTLQYSLYPYKTLKQDGPWLWDSFNFETDIALPVTGEDITIPVGTTKHVYLPPADKPYNVKVAVTAWSAVYAQLHRLNGGYDKDDPDAETMTLLNPGAPLGGDFVYTPIFPVIDRDLGYDCYRLDLAPRPTSDATEESVAKVRLRFGRLEYL